MKFLLTIYADESRYGSMTPEETGRLMQAYEKFGREAQEAGVLLGGEGLQSTATATTVRVRNGERLTGASRDRRSPSSPASSATSPRSLCRTPSWSRSSPGRSAACRTTRPRGSSPPRNRAIDRIRSERRWAGRREALEAELRALGVGADEDDEPMSVVPDERLSLMFAVCHPALEPEARVALTLRALGGLTTPEVARAFLVFDAATAQRIVRAKRKIAVAGIR